MNAIEILHSFEFADDHRAFLAAGLAIGRGWPNWREPEHPDLAERLVWPSDGVLFDVEHNEFWLDDWGARPADLSAALGTARQFLCAAPPMIPVFSHRYLPAGRGTFSHPVLSMYQTDVIYYGADLADYIEREFHHGGIPLVDYPDATVPFWRDIVS